MNIYLRIYIYDYIIYPKCSYFNTCLIEFYYQYP